MLCHVALVRTDVSVEISVVPSSPILVALMKEALSSPEALVSTSATRRNISEDTILHSHRRENLNSYIFKFVYMLFMYVAITSDTIICNGTAEMVRKLETCRRKRSCAILRHSQRLFGMTATYQSGRFALLF
jgi:hypothetical protein